MRGRVRAWYSFRMQFLAAGAALIVAAGVGLANGGSKPQNGAARTTVVVRFEVPPTTQLPHVVLPGACDASRAAWFRDDARRCTAGANVYDPCFATSSDRQILCDIDPRKTGGGVFVTIAEPTATPSPARGLVHRAWFFELTDGSSCRPIAGAGREFDGFVELYSCQFGSDGQADAVLGELDSSLPQWTIRKVLINKKTEPQTIKSLSIAAVKRVWQ